MDVPIELSEKSSFTTLIFMTRLPIVRPVKPSSKGERSDPPGWDTETTYNFV